VDVYRDRVRNGFIPTLDGYSGQGLVDRATAVVTRPAGRGVRDDDGRGVRSELVS
jgi:hypothetical protein